MTRIPSSDCCVLGYVAPQTHPDLSSYFPRYLSSHCSVCTRGSNVTCVVDNDKYFDPFCRSNAHVIWEFAGNNGRIAVIDRVLRPLAHPGARFPEHSLYTLITTHPHLTLFTRLLATAGLLDELRLGLDPLWRSRTVFAPVDSAFSQFTPGQLAYMLGPAGRELAKYIALTHILRGTTYVYTCALKQIALTRGNVTQIMASGVQLVISWVPIITTVPVVGGTSESAYYDQSASVSSTTVTDWALTLGFPGWMSLPSWAQTIPGGTDWEGTTGILHKVDGLLLDSWAWGRLNQGVFKV